MEMQKRRQFIINFLYFGIIFMLAFVLLKYGLPMVSPLRSRFCDCLHPEETRAVSG